jgi:hypothetical protein
MYIKKGKGRDLKVDREENALDSTTCGKEESF